MSTLSFIIAHRTDVVVFLFCPSFPSTSLFVFFLGKGILENSIGSFEMANDLLPGKTLYWTPFSWKTVLGLRAPFSLLRISVLSFLNLDQNLTTFTANLFRRREKPFNLSFPALKKNETRHLREYIVETITIFMQFRYKSLRQSFSLISKVVFQIRCHRISETTTRSRRAIRRSSKCVKICCCCSPT